MARYIIPVSGAIGSTDEAKASSYAATSFARRVDW
jgi:hypothetical protein